MSLPLRRLSSATILKPNHELKHNQNLSFPSLICILEVPGAVSFCIISCHSLYPELPAELSNTRLKLEVCLVQVLEATFISATGSFLSRTGFSWLD